MHHLEHLITFFLLTVSCVVIALPSQKAKTDSTGSDTKVLVLGGGVAGVIAARTLHEQGIDDFVLVEARDELGGRLQSTPFGGHVVELGANWIQGTQTGNGPINPIWTLAKKHGLETHISDFYRSLKTFDETGEMDFVDDVFNAADNNFDNYINYTQAGGFSHDNMLSIDQRGYKMFIQQEAESFLKPQQLRLNTLVDSVEWSASGVKAVFSDGSSISADYAICTFSLGVLKNDDVKFEPDFPNYKTEAIATMTMGTYTKIYLQFPQKFWFDTEFALYADSERGRYPVWQSLDKEGFLPGSGIILVTVTGDYSERIEALSDTEVKEETMSVLRTMYPNITIPEPLDFKFHRWFNDPLYRGSFSNWPPSFVSQHHDNLRANVGRLYFAGEATSQNYYGYLHGAYFEGRDIANVVAKCVNGDSCVSLRRYEKY
ncbi:hypothetical protein C0989_000501 [Termitomyces sp. Mn162]|nr:hypothetical protein C0989_000501 [Termitomyces sp. Mn162]